jgi:hypothetical protein
MNEYRLSSMSIEKSTGGWELEPFQGALTSRRDTARRDAPQNSASAVNWSRQKYTFFEFSFGVPHIQLFGLRSSETQRDRIFTVNKLSKCAFRDAVRTNSEPPD